MGIRVVLRMCRRIHRHTVCTQKRKRMLRIPLNIPLVMQMEINPDMQSVTRREMPQAMQLE